MEEAKCPQCSNFLKKVKILRCKFCPKDFCSISCLINHSSSHFSSFSKITPFLNPPTTSSTSSTSPPISSQNLNIIQILKKKQSLNILEKYPFLTQGLIKDKTKTEQNPTYDLSDFEKVLEDNGIFPVELGKGSYGRVFLVKNKTTQKLYALKVIDKKKLCYQYGVINTNNNKGLDLVFNEINIQSKLDHENIIKLYSFQENEEEIKILLEYAENGSLYSIIKSSKNKMKNIFTEFEAFHYFIQVINAIYFLHDNGIIHRDIKPENILITKDNKIKLCDFGWAKELTVENRSTFCGTMEYMAPEIVENGNYDCGVDIWSLGVLLYEILIGHSPFAGGGDKEVMNNIKTCKEINFEGFDLSDECKDLIRKLLEPNQYKRITIKDILEHPFIWQNWKKKEKSEINKSIYFVNDKIINNNVLLLDDKDDFIDKEEYNENSEKEQEDEFQCLRKPIHYRLRSECVANKIIPKFDKKNINGPSKFNFIINHLMDEGNFNCKENVKIFDKRKTLRDSLRLDGLIKKMNTEINKTKQKIIDLNFRKQPCFSFEDYRDKIFANK